MAKNKSKNSTEWVKRCYYLLSWWKRFKSVLGWEGESIPLKYKTVHNIAGNITLRGKEEKVWKGFRPAVNKHQLIMMMMTIYGQCFCLRMGHYVCEVTLVYQICNYTLRERKVIWRQLSEIYFCISKLELLSSGYDARLASKRSSARFPSWETAGRIISFPIFHFSKLEGNQLKTVVGGRLGWRNCILRTHTQGSLLLLEYHMNTCAALFRTHILSTPYYASMDRLHIVWWRGPVP